MGYWVNTTYINHGNVAEVADALAATCTAEGMERVSPPPRERLLVEPMQYDSALRNDLWGFAIFPGAKSWTAVQTAPLELLAERAAGAARMRLADLCIRLSASAFQFNVYDSSGAILAEVSRDGEIAMSGFFPQGDDPFAWHAERLDEESVDIRFRLHPFQDVIAGAASEDDMAGAIARHFGAHNSAFCDNLVSVDTLISRKPFAAPGGQALYFRWPGPTRQRYSPCGSWAEYRAAITR